MLRKLIASFGVTVVGGALAVAVSATPAYADASNYWDSIDNVQVLYIKCGGQKYGSGWQTYGQGGYSGHTCGSGIDYHITPTGGATDQFTLPIVYPSQSWTTVQAYIPSWYANANMDFTVNVYQSCGTTRHWNWDFNLNEVNVSGWKSIGSFQSTSPHCYQVEVSAWSGVASGGYYLGLDALRVLDGFVYM